MKLGLIGDVHATVAPVRRALALFRAEQTDMILCTGDIAGYGTELEETVALLQSAACASVLGNHDVWRLAEERVGREPGEPADEYLRRLPMAVEMKVAGKRLTMVHASPPASLMDGIRLLDEHGRPIPEQLQAWTEALRGRPCDVLVVGHTHQVFARRLGEILVVNPGSTLFNHTCAILTLPAMTVRILPLGDQPPVLAWNWSQVGRTDGS